jgi:hypothetical protein
MLLLTRIIQKDPPMWSEQVHGVLRIEKDGKSYVYETLERPYKNNTKEISSLKPGVYKLDIINKGTSFPFLQLYGTGRKDARIQVFRESPVWLGTEKVYNVSDRKYEFSDFRECLNELCSLNFDLISINEIHQTKAWHPYAPETTSSYFKPSDDELISIQTSRSNNTD